MRTTLLRVSAAVFGLCMLAALPPALVPGAGWAVTAAIAAVGAALVGWGLRRGHLRPLEELAAQLRPGAEPPGRTSDLAIVLASEYRDLIARLEAAEVADHRQRSALGHAADGVVLIDPDGLVEYANPVARLLVPDRVVDVTRRLTQPELQHLVRRALDRGKPASADLVLRTPEARHVLARAIPLHDRGCVLLFRDRTEADRVDRVRRDFVANVSHELKTPVAGIRALADVAQSALEDRDAESAGGFVERLRKEAERLARLVADLLDLSRVEGGGGLDVQEIEVRALLEAAADRARAVADGKGVAIEVAGSPRTLRADPAQLGMAVQNLVDNAVRYSDRGTVRLEVDWRDGWVVVTVADQGIGIPRDELPRIFERFYRVDRARSRATGGTGLGLAIVRHVVENHGGRVEVHSELGAGSTFVVHLPEAAPRRSPSAA